MNALLALYPVVMNLFILFKLPTDLGGGDGKDKFNPWSSQARPDGHPGDSPADEEPDDPDAPPSGPGAPPPPGPDRRFGPRGGPSNSGHYVRRPLYEGPLPTPPAQPSTTNVPTDLPSAPLAETVPMPNCNNIPMTNPNTGDYVRHAFVEVGDHPAEIPLEPDIPSHVPIFPLYLGDTDEIPSSDQFRTKKNSYC